MPISLRELNDMESTVVVDMWGLGELTLKYKLDGYDDETLKVIDDALKGNNQESVANWRKFILRVATWWDMLDAKGKPLPLNEQSLNKLSGKVVDKIASEIMGDRDPNLTTTGSSQALPEEPSEMSLVRPA